ncbi:MAG: hypothetical protein M0Z31_05625, partial [Clostridia bacterium]|nr:hypothetical protein [Clostridia bacterium]
GDSKPNPSLCWCAVKNGRFCYACNVEGASPTHFSIGALSGASTLRKVDCLSIASTPFLRVFRWQGFVGTVWVAQDSLLYLGG